MQGRDVLQGKVEYAGQGCICRTGLNMQGMDVLQGRDVLQ